MKYSSNVFVNRIKSFGAGWMGPTQIALDGFGFLCAMLAIAAISFSELPLWYMAGPGIVALMFIVHGVIQVVHFRNCRDVSTGNVNRIGLSMKGVFSLVTGIIRSVLFVVAGVVCVWVHASQTGIEFLFEPFRSLTSAFLPPFGNRFCTGQPLEWGVYYCTAQQPESDRRNECDGTQSSWLVLLLRYCGNHQCFFEFRFRCEHLFRVL